MEKVKDLRAMLQRIQDQIDAVANAKREAAQAQQAMGNVRLTLNDTTWSGGPTEAQREVLRSVLANMKNTVASDQAALIRAQKEKSAVAIDCLRAELPRLAALAAIELGQIAKEFRMEATHD